MARAGSGDDLHGCCGRCSTSYRLPRTLPRLRRQRRPFIGSCLRATGLTVGVVVFSGSCSSPGTPTAPTPTTIEPTIVVSTPTATPAPAPAPAPRPPTPLSGTCTILAWACTSAGTYGAISCHIERDRQYCGWSYGYSSQYFAQEAARRSCAGNNALSSCFDVVWFRSQCGAVASAPATNYGWSTGASRDKAESDALAVCHR